MAGTLSVLVAESIGGRCIDGHDEVPGSVTVPPPVVVRDDMLNLSSDYLAGY